MERGSKKIKHLLWDWVLLPQLSEEVATTASTSLDGKMVRPLERLPVKDDSWGWGGLAWSARGMLLGFAIDPHCRQ